MSDVDSFRPPASPASCSARRADSGGETRREHPLLFQRGYIGVGPGALRGRAYRSPHVGRHPTRACATVVDESRLSALPSVARPVRRAEPRAQTAPSGPGNQCEPDTARSRFETKTRFCVAILVRAARCPSKGLDFRWVARFSLALGGKANADAYQRCACMAAVRPLKGGRSRVRTALRGTLRLLRSYERPVPPYTQPRQRCPCIAASIRRGMTRCYLIDVNGRRRRGLNPATGRLLIDQWPPCQRARRGWRS